MSNNPDVRLATLAGKRVEAKGTGRMAGRRILVVGGGQTDYGVNEQPIGNGRAISVLLAVEGASLVVADYDKAAAVGTADLVTDVGASAMVLVGDVRNPNDIEEMVNGASDLLGGLDGVVYNVGITGPIGLTNTTPEAWDDTLNVNLRGALLVARAALPLMEPGSAFVFISSISAITPGARVLAYEASKAGMAAVMRAFAFEGCERSIRSNLIMPGFIDTGIVRHNIPESRSQIAASPLGRSGSGWDVAYATLFLLSVEAAHITGQSLAVDGGATTLTPATPVPPVTRSDSV